MARLNLKDVTEEEIEAKLKAVEERMLTLDQWITSSGKYKDRASSNELTQDVKDKAEDLLSRVNALLLEIGVEAPVSVSSGFRPSSVNNKIYNAAKRSGHITGEAIDLKDSVDQGLYKSISKAMLEKHGLYMENGAHTPSWVHLQTRPTKSGNRIFIP